MRGRYLVFMPTSGLGNSMLAMVSAFVLAVAMQVRRQRKEGARVEGARARGHQVLAEVAERPWWEGAPFASWGARGVQIKRGSGWGMGRRGRGSALRRGSPAMTRAAEAQGAGFCR